MNRAQRRASQYKRGQHWDRNDVAASAVLSPLLWSRDFDADESARLSTEVLLAWHHITHGQGETQHFDLLANMANVLVVRAEAIDPMAEDVALRCQQALLRIKARYLRLGQFGADALALQDVPPALDLYDQLLSLSTPLQMTQALRESLARMQRGELATLQG